MPPTPCTGLKVNIDKHIVAIMKPNLSNEYFNKHIGQKYCDVWFDEWFNWGKLTKEELEENNKPFLVNIYQRDNEQIETYAMTLDNMGKYSNPPKQVAKNLHFLVNEHENWIKGIFDYMKKKVLNVSGKI